MINFDIPDANLRFQQSHAILSYSKQQDVIDMGFVQEEIIAESTCH